MYIVQNIKDLCKVFPQFSGLIIGLINGIFDAGAGIFLLFKIMYDSNMTISLKEMLIAYAICSVIIWIKTLCFSAENPAPGISIFSVSPLGRLFGMTKGKHSELEKESMEEQTEAPDSFWKYLFSVKYLMLVCFYTPLTIRANSFPSWLYPWLKWSFSILEETEAENNVSVLMDVYG